MTYQQAFLVLLGMLIVPIAMQGKPENPPDPVKMDLPATALVAAFRSELSAVKDFAQRKKDKADFEFIEQAEKEGLQDLSILENKRLTQITLWALNEDVKFLDEYKRSGDSEYLKASINDIKSTILANLQSGSKEKEVTITVTTVPENGYQVWYKPADWADLPNAPAQTFGKPSECSASLPKDKKYLLWSSDYIDGNKVGLRSPLITDAAKDVTIGAPPSKPSPTKG